MEENKVVNDTASFGGDVPPILPDGWEKGENLLVEEDDELAKLLADGQEADPSLSPENNDVPAAPTAPTTGDAGGAEVPDAGTEPPQTDPDGGKLVEPPASRKLLLRVNHEDQEVDINAMSDDELRVLLQKGKAFDAMKDAENKRTYQQVYQEQVDAGMTEAAARMVAKDAAGGRTYALPNEEDDPQTAEPPASAQPAGAPKMGQTRDLRAEVEQLRALYPDVKEMPDEVAKSISQGVPVITAYLAYRDKQSAQTAADLRKENQILKQNAANSTKAPVRGVTGGDSTPPKKKSLFEEGFDAGFKWGMTR